MKSPLQLNQGVEPITALVDVIAVSSCDLWLH